MDVLNSEEIVTVKKQKESNQLILQPVKPKTANQKKIFEAYDENKNLFIHGIAGSGKSYLALYLGLESVLNKEFKQMVIVRSAVPSRKQGFLPGSPEEKDEIYELPYYGLCSQLFNKQDAYKLLKGREQLKFISTSYLRGMTLDNSIIFVDEVQNMNFQEISTIMTRIGDNCNMILAGDEDQNDLESSHEDSCIKELHSIIDKMPSFKKIEMGVEDICRNDIVREWILARNPSKASNFKILMKPIYV